MLPKDEYPGWKTKMKHIRSCKNWGWALCTELKHFHEPDSAFKMSLSVCVRISPVRRNHKLLYAHDKMSLSSEVKGLKQAATAVQMHELYGRFLWHTARPRKADPAASGMTRWNVKLTLTTDWLLCLRAEQGLTAKQKSQFSVTVVVSWRLQSMFMFPYWSRAATVRLSSYCS